MPFLDNSVIMLHLIDLGQKRKIWESVQYGTFNEMFKKVIDMPFINAALQTFKSGERWRGRWREEKN